MAYPMNLKQTTGLVDNIPTSISVHEFSDKILITITQEGRLAQWFQVSMDSQSLSQRSTYLPRSGPMNGAAYEEEYHHHDADDQSDSGSTTQQDDDSLLPLSHLTARTLLGASTPQRETTGQLYAVQIASAIALKSPNETRSVLLGLGLKGSPDSVPSREQFFDLLELVVTCL